MNKSSKPSSRVKILFIGLLFFVILSYFTGFGNLIQNFYLEITSPLQATIWSRAISVNENSFEDKKDQSGKIADLERQLKEMESLRELLNLGDYQQFKLTDGRVVGKSTESDSLIISLGSNDGLKKGMPVITSSKELIGKVYNVLPDFAHVQLITNKEVSFGAKVEGKDDSLGILKNDDGLSLEMIEREVDLEKGDKIITHPEDGIYPEGILIGEIREVVKDDASAFQSVLVNPAFNPKDIAYLFVITDF